MHPVHHLQISQLLRREQLDRSMQLHHLLASAHVPERPRHRPPRTRPARLSQIVAVLAVLVVGLALIPGIAAATPVSIDWTDRPTAPIPLADDWTVVACDGDAPLLCTAEDGAPQGTLEHLAFDLAGYPEDLQAVVADGTPARPALARHVASFLETFRQDREQSCPAGWTFTPHPTIGVVVGGQSGLRYGFTVADVDGHPVEVVHNFIAVRDDGQGGAVDVVSANEHNAGSCVGDDEGQPFRSGGLDRFLPNLTQLVARSTFGEGSQAAPSLVLDGRLAADDAVGAAIALTTVAFPDDNASTVLLARDDEFADALAAGGAQGLLDAPLLLTGGGALDDRVRAELTRLGTRRVVILGGTAAVSPAVEQALIDAGWAVDRIAGPDRIGTATAIAERLVAETTRVVLVRADTGAGDASQAYADALAAGARAAAEGIPVLLTNTDTLDDRVAGYLEAAGVQQVVIAGGTAAVSGAVEASVGALGIDVDRAEGAERAETATLLAAGRGIPTAAYAETVVLVDGRIWVDGLVAAGLGHRALAPVVLSAGATLPPATQAFLATTEPTTRPTLLCMPSVDPAACDAAATALNGGTPVQPS